MAKKERSFFGKIMGSDDDNDDVQANTDDLAEMSEKNEELELSTAEELEVLEDDDLEDLDEEEEMEVVSRGSSQKIAQEEEDDEDEEDEEEEDEVPSAPVKKSSGEHEDWLSDYEGQLNIDMYQTKDNVIIKSTIAGVRPEDIDITVANDMVTIKGIRKREEKIVEDDYFYQECYWGNFSRSVIVPVDIDSENIEADLKDGILTIVVPKAAKAKTKKIKVKGL